jgi:small subunit ribosomal protein S1
VFEYGAFVDLGGVDGLLHVTDMAWRRINHPSEILNIGDSLKVQIVKINKDTQRISLGMKQLEEDPWSIVETKYSIGSTHTGRVTNITDYGAFVELAAGVEGLVHVSEMDWTNRNIHPSKVVSVGDEVEVMILEIDEGRRRISLGIKQCKPNPWEEFEISNEKGQRIKGNIKSITDFGIFIGLDGGIDGLVHLSDISWTEPGEEAVRNYSKGEEIETLILSVDAERERISLGIKQLEKDPFADFLESNSKGSIVKAKILEIEEKEATLELAVDVSVVLKSSDMSVDRVDDARKVLSQGQEIEVKLTNVDSKNRHIGVSIKAIAIDEERQAVRDHKKKEDVKSSSATIGDLIKAEMEKEEED